jgi:predicted TIM-barrel fold metal-dependent hydrolase
LKETIIDFHVHLAKYESYTVNCDELLASAYPTREEYEQYSKKYSNPKNFLQLMDEKGIDYSVIIAEITPLTTGVSTNEMVEAFCRESPRLIPFCTLNPYQHPNMGNLLEDLILHHGFKGLKLYPPYNYFYPNDNFLYPLYAVAERLGIPVNFHTGSSIFANSRIKYGNPIYFDNIAVDFPDMKIIMAHGGRGPWHNEALNMIRLHKNVYIDVAGLPPKKLIEYFPDLERFSHKFIFGTDWPTPAFNIVNMKASPLDAKKNIEMIRNLNISQRAITNILGENAKQLLGLV